ncbi:MAG TPA: menaquinone-dependent protoporphyrinogen IX dehydrogenase [Wenzhouxiangellaceae bacterium]|nr:menaquinone-dependent protoporphyrinogen IX dehydrogenase [Wenzhouxiangellaceae bacterium]
MPNTLIVYATTDGQTRKISERIQQTLRANGLETTLVDVAKASALDPAGFDGVIAGASVRYGKHDPAMARFLDDNRDAIARLPNAFFSVNLIARKPEKRNLDGNKYLRKFLERLSFQPMHVEIIAGKLDYPSYRFIDRIMIQMIMKITDGPTDGKSVIEYTDWDQVDGFARRMAKAIAAPNESTRESDDPAARGADQPGTQGN